MTSNKKKFNEDIRNIVRQYHEYVAFTDCAGIFAERPRGAMLRLKKIAVTLKNLNIEWRTLPEHVRKRLAAEAEFESLVFCNTPIPQTVFINELLSIVQSLERAAQVVIREAPKKRVANERRKEFLRQIAKVFKAHKKSFTPTIDPIYDRPSRAVEIVSEAFGISEAAASKQIQRFKKNN